MPRLSPLHVEALMRALSSPVKRLYRAEAPSALKRLPDWLRQAPEFTESQRATGRWWGADPGEQLDWYTKDAGEGAQRFFLDLPEVFAEGARVDRAPDEVRRFSRDPELEYFLPSYLTKGRRPME